MQSRASWLVVGALLTLIITVAARSPEPTREFKVAIVRDTMQNPDTGEFERIWLKAAAEQELNTLAQEGWEIESITSVREEDREVMIVASRERSGS